MTTLLNNNFNNNFNNTENNANNKTIDQKLDDFLNSAEFDDLRITDDDLNEYLEPEKTNEIKQEKTNEIIKTEEKPTEKKEEEPVKKVRKPRKTATKTTSEDTTSDVKQAGEEPVKKVRKSRKVASKTITEGIDTNEEEASDIKQAGTECNTEPLKKTKETRKKKGAVEEVKISKLIQLLPYQVKHKNKLVNIFKESPFALDFSMLGAGKTFTSSFIFQNHNEDFKHIISISPVSVKTKWSMVEKEYGFELYRNVSYCELRGIKFKQPKHNLLKRRDYVDLFEQADGAPGNGIGMNAMQREVEKVEYSCTKEYLDKVNEGILLVIDEIQCIKNISNTMHAAKELIRPIVESFRKGGKSRVLLLSGSPIDKKEQALNLFKTLHIMKNDRITAYNPQTGENMWRGMSEIEAYCRRLDNDMVEVCRAKYKNVAVLDRHLEDYCYELFNRVLKNNLSSVMLPELNDYKIDKRNAYYWTNNKKDIELLKMGIAKLKSASQFNGMNGTVNFGNNGARAISSIQTAMLQVETAKINLFHRIGLEKLEENPNNKIVIAVNYTDTIKDLMTLFHEYSPLKLDGSMTFNQRGESLRKFQKPDTEYRILICNISVASSGIDLDDKDGNFHRTAFVSPNYSTITLYQLSHRFSRADTKSDCQINFVFAMEDSETKILNALSRKGTIMKEVSSQQADAGVVFPGSYADYKEPDVKNIFRHEIVPIDDEEQHLRNNRHLTTRERRRLEQQERIQRQQQERMQHMQQHRQRIAEMQMKFREDMEERRRLRYEQLQQLIDNPELMREAYGLLFNGMFSSNNSDTNADADANANANANSDSDSDS